MSRNNDSWGIEVGVQAIKAIRLVKDRQGVTLVEYDVLPFKQVLTTPELRVDEAIQLHLDLFLSRHDVRGSRVVVSVPGSMGFAKFTKLPPVDPKKFADIVKFEAVQQIPFPIDQVEWDYQIFQQADSPDVEVGIFAITKERLARVLNNYHTVGIQPDGVTLSALAVYNAMCYDMDLTPQSPGMVFMDIGTSCTDVIIVDAGNLWLRTIPIGGNNFTEALVQAFKVTYQKAEKLKCEAFTTNYARQVFQAMRPVFADLVLEVQRTLGYYQSFNRDAQLKTIVGLGSTFRLPGIRKFLSQQLQIEVVRHSAYKKLATEGKQAAHFAEHALNLATAYGLALQGLGLERVSANLLPAGVVKHRLWQAKRPWIAAAAALMVATAGAAWVKTLAEESAYDALVKQNESRIASVLEQAAANVQKWRQIEGGSDPRQRIENLRRILDYRELWPAILYDLTLAARSLQEQSELLVPDYESIKRIPRDQRRRVYIQSVTAEYVFGDQGLPSTGGSEPTGPATAEAIWGPLSPANEGSPQGGTDAGAPRRVPSFVITIKGTTPYKDGSSLLGQKFLGWLQSNAQRADRPYRIVATQQSLVKIERVGQSEPETRPPTGYQPRTPSRAPVRPQPPGRAAPPSRGKGGEGVRVIGSADYPLLLPQRPLQDEPRSGDWAFEIRWTVELVRPEEARQVRQIAAETGEATHASLPAPQAEQTR